MKKKIGIFAGTFDPVHEGHISFVRHAIEVLELDQVYIIPEPIPVGKINVTPLPHRLEMARMMFHDSPAVIIWETKLPTARMPETIRELNVNEDELYILMGSDVAFGLKTWSNFQDIIQRCQLVIGIRDDQDKKRLNTLMAHLGVLSSGYTLIKTESSGLSSSQIRQGFVPNHPNLQNYIRKHHLYSV